MSGFERAWSSAWSDFEAGLQQAIYYAIFIDVVLLIALGVFIWCCCVYVLSYRKIVDENLKLKKTERQYLLAKKTREEFEIKRLKTEFMLSDELDGRLSDHESSLVGNVRL